MKRLFLAATALCAAAPAAHAVTTWQGSIVIYQSTVECRNFTTDPSRKFYNGNTFRSVLKPAGIDNNGTETDVSFIGLRGARSYRLFNWDGSDYSSSGKYEMRGVQGFGRWTGNTVSMEVDSIDGFSSFVMAPKPTVLRDNIRISGWINNFSNIAGCNIFVRGTFVR